MEETMHSVYDAVTAFHYDAFRPMLHLPILKESLQKEDTFQSGLDVGCGTGQSAIALTHFCKKVTAIDPSLDMLQKAKEHSKIQYSQYNKKGFDFPEDTFEILTFAGSLYYAKSQNLLNEVVRVSKPKAIIIVYDFELLLTDILEKLHLDSAIKPQIPYDHETGFEGLNTEKIRLEKSVINKVSIAVSSLDLAHLLLSSKGEYLLLARHFGKENLYTKVAQKLHTIFNIDHPLINVVCYSKSYRNLK